MKVVIRGPGVTPPYSWGYYAVLVFQSRWYQSLCSSPETLRYFMVVAILW
ncbi:hypothetical protein ACFLW6_04475 [Chloroflexota bacterium]